MASGQSEKNAGKPKLSSKFNREASRLRDVGSEDPSFQAEARNCGGYRSTPLLII
jgi:hypothetical protein